MKKTLVLHISPLQARELALREAQVEEGRFESQRLLRDGARVLYELEFTTGEMAYTCYLDAESGEAVGLDFRPVPVESYPDYYLVPESMDRETASA